MWHPPTKNDRALAFISATAEKPHGHHLGFHWRTTHGGLLFTQSVASAGLALDPHLSCSTAALGSALPLCDAAVATLVSAECCEGNSTSLFTVP